MSNKLYPFQQEDVDRMKTMPHVLLFSDMGTGKTIETIWHTWENNLLPCLIICPTSLKLNWWDEIKKWTGEESIYCDTADQLVEIYFDTLLEEPRPKYFIIHHEALAYVYEDTPIREMITRIPWKCVAVDECHRFRNEYTNRTRTLLDFKERTQKFIFISGTPIVNSTFDIFPLLKLLGIERNEGRFLEMYTWGRTRDWGYQISGSKNTSMLLEKIAPYYIRRTKAEVLRELPSKTYQVIRLVMPQDQREVYDRYEEMLCMMLDEGEELSSPNILSLNTRLRQLSLDPTIIGRSTHSSKTKAILELLEQSQEKWVVATTSKLFVDHIKPKIENCLTLTGEDALYERHDKLNLFRINPNRKVLLTTIFTGGLGLNLQAANNLIVADPWWHGAIIEQQVDRIYRIGQTKPVLIYKLVNTNSIDEDMYAKISEKDKMAQEIVVEQEVIKRIYERRRGFAYQPPVREEVENG